jgi:plastocyanin
MHRRTFLGAGAIAVAGLAGCAGSSDGDADGSGDGGGPNSVDMVTEGGQYYFDPIGLHVEPGTTVTWVNESGRHSSTAYVESSSFTSQTRIPESAEPWNSETITEQGATFQHTFETEGTYDYFCIPHKSLGMIGRVVVGSPGGPADGSMPRDGEVPESDRIVDEGAVPFSEFS